MAIDKGPPPSFFFRYHIHIFDMNTMNFSSELTKDQEIISVYSQYKD